jgi:hypothetical protein
MDKRRRQRRWWYGRRLRHEKSAAPCRPAQHRGRRCRTGQWTPLRRDKRRGRRSRKGGWKPASGAKLSSKATRQNPPRKKGRAKSSLMTLLRIAPMLAANAVYGRVSPLEAEALAVEPQQVVPVQCKTAEGRLAPMGPPPRKRQGMAREPNRRRPAEAGPWARGPTRLLGPLWPPAMGAFALRGRLNRDLRRVASKAVSDKAPDSARSVERAGIRRTARSMHRSPMAPRHFSRN